MFAALQHLVRPYCLLYIILQVICIAPGGNVRQLLYNISYCRLCVQGSPRSHRHSETILYIIYHIAGYVCEAAPDHTGTVKTISGDTVTYTCVEGTIFPDGEISVTFACTCSTKWSSISISTCQGNYGVGEV